MTQISPSEMPSPKRPGAIRWAPLFGLLLVSPLLRGSSCTHIERPYPPPTAEALVKAIKDQGQRVRTLRAETRMAHKSSEGRLKGTVRLMAARGGKLRFDAVSPFDTPLATLVSDGKEFSLIDAQKNRHFHGPASPCNISRLLQVALSADDMLTILGGSMPLISPESASVAWDSREGQEVLTLRSAALTQVVRLYSHQGGWDLVHSEIKDNKGEILLSVQADNHRRVSGLRLPAQLSVSQPGLSAELDITFKQQELNLELPAVAFELLDAGGLPSQRVECDTDIQ